MTLNTKKCIGCNEIFDNSNFYKKQSRCKTCHKAKTKQYSKDNPEIVAKCKTPEYNRKYNLKRTHNLTTEEWQKQFETQQGCCAACGKHQSSLKRRLCVDHNHETGNNRLLLCSNCNCALGYVKEDVGVLQGLIKYVQKYC